jgi:hypothetical protein
MNSALKVECAVLELAADFGMLVAYAETWTARMIGCGVVLPAAENPFQILEYGQL